MADRNTGLSPRQVNTKAKAVPKIVRFEPQQIKDHFNESISKINSMFNIFDQLMASKQEEQAKDILRTQIVFLVSALDFYVHEITKYGLVRIFDGDWDLTEKYSNICVPMNVLNEALKQGESSDWFVDFINDRFSSMTFVSYESIKGQMNLLGLKIQLVADTVFSERGSTVPSADKLKNRLDELFHRRNVIAHQFDRRHENAETLDIDRKTVEDYINDVERIIDAIENQLLKK